MPNDSLANRGETRRDVYSPSLQQTAAALWGDGFWGRDQSRDGTVKRHDTRAPREPAA